MADVLKQTLETANFITDKYESFSPEEEKQLIEIMDTIKLKIRKKISKTKKMTQAKVVSLDKYKKLSGLS